MPITTKGKIALRKNLRKAKRNRVALSNLKTMRKKTVKAIETKTADAEKNIKETIKVIDRQIQKGRIKKNTGARMKSRMVKSYNKTKATATSK